MKINACPDVQAALSIVTNAVPYNQRFRIVLTYGFFFAWYSLGLWIAWWTVQWFTDSDFWKCLWAHKVPCLILVQCLLKAWRSQASDIDRYWPSSLCTRISPDSQSLLMIDTVDGGIFKFMLREFFLKLFNRGWIEPLPTFASERLCPFKTLFLIPSHVTNCKLHL